MYIRYIQWWHPWWLRLKESACSAGDQSSIPWSRRSLGVGNGNLLHTLAWEIPWTEEPDSLYSMGLHRIRQEEKTSSQVGGLGKRPHNTQKEKWIALSSHCCLLPRPMMTHEGLTLQGRINIPSKKMEPWTQDVGSISTAFMSLWFHCLAPDMITFKGNKLKNRANKIPYCKPEDSWEIRKY